MIALALVAVSSCGGGKKKEAVETAQKFISAYFAADYQTALSLCSGDFKSKVQESEDMINTLPDSLKQAFYDLAAQMETHTNDVYEYSSDSLLVDFDILVPGEIEPLRNAVCVVLNSGTDMWEVVEMK